MPHQRSSTKWPFYIHGFTREIFFADLLSRRSTIKKEVEIDERKGSILSHSYILVGHDWIKKQRLFSHMDEESSLSPPKKEEKEKKEKEKEKEPWLLLGP